MRIVLGILGVGLVLLAAVDVLWTTVLLEAGGPVSSRVAPALWKLMLRSAGSSRRHKFLSYAGLLIIVATLMLWLGLLWLGWTLVFNMTRGAVVGDMSLRPAGFWTRLAFVGGNLATAGPGSYRAGSPVWHILSAVSSASGFFLVTLGAAYLLPLVAAVVEQRQLAGYITALAERGEPAGVAGAEFEADLSAPRDGKDRELQAAGSTRKSKRPAVIGLPPGTRPSTAMV